MYRTREGAMASLTSPALVNLQALLRRLSRICRSRMGSTVNAPRFRTPKPVVKAHPPDQRPQICSDLRPASQVPRFPAPIAPKTSTMPAHEGLGPDDHHGLEHRWKPTI